MVFGVLYDLAYVTLLFIPHGNNLRNPTNIHVTVH